MKPVLLRSIFIFCGTILQVSLANMLFASWLFPLPIAISIIVSFTLLKGFSFSWKWAVFSGVLLDAIALERIGVASLELVLVAALLSFTAKELLFGYRFGRVVFFGSVVWIFSAGFFFVEMIFLLVFSEKTMSFSLSLLHISWMEIFWSFLFSIATFALIFPLTSVFERYLELFERTKVGR